MSTSNFDLTIADILGESADARPTAPERRVIFGRVQHASPDVVMMQDVAGRSLLLPATEIPAEKQYSPGHIVATLVLDDNDPITVSASHPQLAAALLESVVPEIRNGDIRIMGVARTAGRRTKIAVASTIEGLDPVPVCVGPRANRVDAVSQALGKERTDIVAWHPDRKQRLANALNPLEVIEVRVTGKDALVRVPRQQVAAAVGEGGHNSSLAGKLTGLQVTVEAA